MINPSKKEIQRILEQIFKNKRLVKQYGNSGGNCEWRGKIQMRKDIRVK